MTFEMRRGPLPDNHPLKGGLIIFGAKRPDFSAKPSTTEAAAAPSNKEETQEEFEAAETLAYQKTTAQRLPPEARARYLATLASPPSPGPSPSSSPSPSSTPTPK